MRPSGRQSWRSARAPRSCWLARRRWRPGPALLKLLQETYITTVTLPPSLLGVLEPSALPGLETVIAAGERCTNEIVKQWASPHRRFFNAYGPTETTVCATMQLCEVPPESAPSPSAFEAWPFGGPPIGRPIANFQCYVVDPFAGPGLQLQPIGVPGELLVGGVGLAKGYLDRPELTSERFIQSPFNRSEEKPGFWNDRLYRTGDLVRWLPTGDLEFLGRIDDQVKVRGFRIELGEIESVLREHPAVQDAVVALAARVPAATRSSDTL